MRYTLRLLTLDQLARAAGLVCALELEREKDAARYGEWPFEIGLWVGKAATPNILGHKGDGRSDSARTKVRQFKADPKGKPSPIPLENCPWCGTRFGPDSFALLPNDDQPRELRIVCTNFECDFTRDRPLPIVAVDEPLYRRLPAFLIATVDKFASLPWVGQAGALLGGAERHDATGFYGAAEPGKGTRLAAPLPPPDLVIQDELHLISGPLGTMAGLYEAAIEALCVREIDGRAVRPKIVASTATVRRAQDQIQALFARPLTQVFPPPGPDRRDSFFARTVPSSETPARLYLGIAAQGRNPKVIMRKAWLALMGAAERAYRDAGGHKNEQNPADPYMTVLGYFNSLRELGGARRILEEEVQNTIKAYGSRKRIGEERGLFQDRKTFSEVVELTSRVSTDKVAEARRRLEAPFHKIEQRVDCAIATNMISVGLDIPRLGLMVVLGQPKTHAEYIQATSRVGRDDERPGLVVTLLNIHKPRDRSHYERFRHYHETFYRSVEVASVTPFSARALDRGFAGALVGLARHAEPELTPPQGVEQIADVRAALERRLLDAFLERVRQQPFADEAEREERLRSVQNRVVDLLDSWRKIFEDYRAAGVAHAVPEVRAEAAQAAASRDARQGLRVRAPPEVPRQPLAPRRGARGEPVPEGSERHARWRTAHEPEGARADPPRPGHHHLRARRADRPAEAFGDRRRARHLAEDQRSGGDRRAPAHAQAPDHDGRRRAAALRAAARFERSPRARQRNRRLALSGMVRRAGGRRQRGARAIPPAGPSQGARRQGSLRRPAGRGHSLRARLPEGTRRRSRLAPLRARRRGRLPATALARRARHERRPGRPGRALRVRQVAQPLRGHVTRGEPARHLPRRAAVAWDGTRTRTAICRAAC